jgi:putative glutamine amidotransferase
MDELPEALEDPALRFALGVQWHPEADETSRFVAALVDEAARARERHHAARNGAGH